MTCARCMHEFCWICLGSWQTHSDYYTCKRPAARVSPVKTFLSKRNYFFWDMFFNYIYFIWFSGRPSSAFSWTTSISHWSARRNATSNMPSSSYNTWLIFSFCLSYCYYYYFCLASCGHCIGRCSLCTGVVASNSVASGSEMISFMFLFFVLFCFFFAGSYETYALGTRDYFRLSFAGRVGRSARNRRHRWTVPIVGIIVGNVARSRWSLVAATGRALSSKLCSQGQR